MQDEIVAPGVNLLESMRSVGYSLEAAIADLIDNSVAAHASRVQIDIDPIDAAYIAILDDGDGMSTDQAREALRLAGSAGERSPEDLGRFGLGLKTASLSQARCLTVVTRRDHRTTGVQWDIDHILSTGAWSLQRLNDDEMSTTPWWERFDSQASGTLVVLRRLDLLLGDTPEPGPYLAGRVQPLRLHLSLVFHRYLHRRAGGISIVVNGVELRPFDPFLEGNPHTQTSPTQRIPIGGEQVEVTAFTLPHNSGLSAQERQRPDMGEAMSSNQGFYVYRNRRLISRGHWFGMARVSELSKQTRIRVDLPNSLDHLWQLDIKKSRAEPPASFKAELRRLLDGVIDRGRRVHTYRGRTENPADASHLWGKVNDRNGFRYDVNLENPLVAATLGSLDSRGSSSVTRLLEAVSATFPVYDLYVEMARSTAVTSSELQLPEIEDSLRQIRDSGVMGADVDRVHAALVHAEPFDRIENLRLVITKIWEEGAHGAQ